MDSSVPDGVLEFEMGNWMTVFPIIEFLEVLKFYSLPTEEYPAAHSSFFSLGHLPPQKVQNDHANLNL
jgi:hypothetical protein